ncbi:MAG: phosphosulfolactate synthase [Cyanobacteria bacterium P01_H01_bin.35]
MTKVNQEKFAVNMPDFLELPERKSKPRNTGITNVIDRGIGLRQAQDLLEIAANFIDVIKLGWGTSYVTQNLSEKISLYQSFGINVCFGGTLFEVVVLQNKFDEFRKYLQKLNLNYVEVSTGSINLPLDEKCRYIEALARDFVVLSEVGSKDPEQVIPPYIWIKNIKAELAAGAWKVIAEARENGTAGIYRSNGEVRFGLIEEILTQIDFNDLIFETPKKAQQIWSIKKFGHLVNLGNIAVDDVISLETLRLGLRSDTLETFHKNSQNKSMFNLIEN